MAGLLTMTHGASGQAVQVTADVTQQVEVTRNADFESDDTDLAARTRLGLHLLSETSRSRFTADTGMSLSFGSDDEATVGRPNLKLGLSTDTKRVQYSAGLSYAQAPVEFDETQPDLSVLSFDADKTTIGAQLGAAIDLTPTSTGGVSLTYSRIDFDETTDDLVASDDFNLTGTLTYELNSRTSFGFNTGLRYFTAEDDVATETKAISFGGSVTQQVTPRLTFSTEAGISLLDTTRDTGGGRASQTDTVGLFGFDVDYELPKGNLGLTLGRSISASGSGELQADTSIKLAFNQDINQYGAYSIAASYVRQEDLGGGETENFVSISPSIDWELAPDLTGGAMYQFQQDDDGETSHKVGVFLTKGFNLSGG